MRLHPSLSATFLGITVALAASPVAPVRADAARSLSINPSTHLPAGVTPVLHGQPSITTSRHALHSAPVNATAVPPHLHYYGGPVLSHVKVIQVLYGAPSLTTAYEPAVQNLAAPSIASFYQTATNSFYFDWLSEYNAGGQAIGRGGFQQQIAITPALANDGPTIDDTKIQAELKAQVAANVLPVPDGNTLFAVYFPVGKTITITTTTTSGTTVAMSGVDFCGYHGTTSTPEMAYSVLPDFSTGGMATPNCTFGSEFQSVTRVSSHEVVEAITDPEVGLANSPAPPLAWYDTNFPGEVADICQQFVGNIQFPDGRLYVVQAQWSNRQGACVFSGPQGVVAVNDTSNWVMNSTGFHESFWKPIQWSSTAFRGSVATLSGDVAGSGHDALVAVNGNSVWVMTSNGSAFSAPTMWANTSIAGTRGTMLADVNGDGKADLLTVNNNFTQVMLSTGSGFAAPVLWSGSVPFYGSRATLAADINGDGKADLIAVNGYSIYVMTSTGFGFSPPALWSSAAFYGTRTTLAGDVNGDGLADLVAVNDNSTWVVTSTGNRFSAPTRWLSGPLYGSRATLLGDVHGDGVDALVAVNDSSVYVGLSNVGASLGTAFRQPTLWSTAAFFGTRATLLGN